MTRKRAWVHVLNRRILRLASDCLLAELKVYALGDVGRVHGLIWGHLGYPILLSMGVGAQNVIEPAH